MVEQNLLHAVERVSIQCGYNPGRFMLIACGGAGPMHGASVGRRLGANAVYVPRQAGAFCAIGMQRADVRRDFVQVLMRELDENVADAIQHGYRRLQTQALVALAEEGFDASSTTFAHELDLHYEGQQWDVRVALAPDATPGQLRAAFEAEYDRQFGHTVPESRVNIAKLRVVGTAKLPPLMTPVYELTDALAEPVEMRPVYAGNRGEFMGTPVYHGGSLGYGQGFDGPAVIEEATTTVLVGPDDRLSVDKFNNYVITFVRGD